MLKHDAAQLAESLNGLAEAFDRKPLTQKALEIWFGTLREFGAELIFGLLSTWPKQHSKFPVPAEIWTIATSIGTGDRERSAALEREVNKRPLTFTVPTETGKRLGAALKAAVQHRKKSPIEHWTGLLARSKPGSIGHEYATQALAILDRKRRKDREPGEDMEEAAA